MEPQKETPTTQNSFNPKPEEEKSIGSTIGIIIIILIIILGGLYFLGQRVDRETKNPDELILN